MLSKMIETILGLAKIEQVTVSNAHLQLERFYTSKILYPVKEPMAEAVDVSTLTGLIDLVLQRVNGFDPAMCFIQVDAYNKVSLQGTLCTKWGDRQMHVLASLPDLGHFEFGRFMEQEPFIVGLQAFFGATDDRETVLKIASNLTGELVALSDDDGISQRATLRSGVVLKTETTVKRLVSLKPWRTFREIDQPESNFIFRLRSKPGEIPTCALFEADGGMWKNEAVTRIKAWIEAHYPGISVIA